MLKYKYKLLKASYFHFQLVPKFLIFKVINLSQNPGKLYIGPGFEKCSGLFVKSDFLPTPKFVFDDDLRAIVINKERWNILLVEYLLYHFKDAT